MRRHGATDESPPEQVRRALLRHRKLHTKAIFGISDDKKHDSYAAQWFMKATLDLLKLAYVDTGIERFFAIHACTPTTPGATSNPPRPYSFSRRCSPSVPRGPSLQPQVRLP